MKKKNYAALAVALVTGGLNSQSKAGLYSPSAIQNGGFGTDYVALPGYTYNQAIANWYRVSGNEQWTLNNNTVSGAPNSTYAQLLNSGSTPGELFQSIGTFTPNYNVSVSLLEGYISGSAGHNVTVSLYSGGAASNTGQLYFGYSGYGEGYFTYKLSGATLLGSKTIADTGSSAFNLSSFILNTGTAGTAGQSLWLDISTDATDGTALAVDQITATGATVFNLAKWKGTLSNTWDASTANFQTSGGTSTAFANGADVLFDDTVTAAKTSITLSGNVSPSTITFNNSSNTFTLSGSGSITGGTSLTMNGTGKVFLNTANSFTGPVSLNSGTVVLENGTALGASRTVNVASGATLAFQSSSGATFDYPAFISGTGVGGGGVLQNISGTNTLGGVVYLLGDSTINVSSGSLTLASAVYGTGALTKTGAGSLVLNSKCNFTGDTNVNGGTIVSNWYNNFIGTNLNINAGGTVDATVGYAVESTNVNVASGGNLILSSSFAETNPTLNISGGTVTATTNDTIGYGTNHLGTVNITNGGTFVDAAVGSNSNQGFDTTFNFTGGNLTATGTGGYNFDVTSGASIISNASSTISLISGPIRLRDDNGGGSLVFTVAQGTVSSGIDLKVSGAISGGTDVGIDKEGPGTLALTGSNTYTGGITVNGGILMFGDGTASNDGSVNASNTISDNAAVVYNTYSAQSFGGAINGSGTVTKIGSGILTLSGTSGYSGATNVAAGVLYVAAGGSITGSSGVTVAAGATLGGAGTVSVPVTVNPGGIIEGGQSGAGQLTVGSLSFLGTATVNIGALSNYSSGTAVNITGALSTSGANSVNISISNLTGVTTGTAYELIGYGSESGTGLGAFKVSLPRGYVGTTSDTGSQIDLTLSSLATGSYFMEWTGTGNAANGWDTTTSNWKYNGTGTATTYIDSPGDPVVFDDGAGSNTTVAIKSGDVHPTSVTFNNNTSNYVLSGPNGIAGAAGVTLNGTGTVTLENTNRYTGATVINAGTLQLGNGTSGNDGTVSDVGGITDNAALVFDNFGALTYGGLIAGTGTVTKNGPGTLTLTGISNSSSATLGTLTVNAGTVVLGISTGPTGTESQEGYSSIIVNSGAVLETAETHIFGYYGGFRPQIVINGGTLLNGPVSNYLGSITMTGGTITGVGAHDLRLASTSDSPSYASVTTIGTSVPAVISIPVLSFYSTSAVFNISQGTVASGVDLLISSSIGEQLNNGVPIHASLAKTGAGTLELTGTNTYTGGTNISGGKLIFASAAAFPAASPLVLTSGTVVAANHGSAAKNNIVTSSLSFAGTTGAWTGQLDLTNNDMIVQAGNLANVFSQLAQGYNNGAWNGSGGIISSAAAVDSTHLHALGVISNDNGSGSPLYPTFDGTTSNDGDVLVKYTYYGDATLDGKVDGADYSRIDNGVLMGLTGWANGDFNYDGVINGSDYTLIDNAYNTQGALIQSEVASPTAQIAGGISAVPEPTTLGLLGLGAIGLLSRRKHRKN